MIKIYQKKIGDNKINELSEFKAGSWIFAKEASEEDILSLEEKYKLDRNILTDALDTYEVPRIEKDEDIVYIFMRVPQKAEGKTITKPLLIAIGPNFILTFSKSDEPILNRFIEGGINFITTQKTQLVLKILSEIMKNYNFFLTGINKDVKESSGKFNKINEKVIINFVEFEEILNDFLLGLSYASPALQGLLAGKLVKLHEDDKELTEDIILSTNQLIELSKSTLKSIVNIREAYSTIMTNDLNRVIKLFTSLTVILTIPTIIASLYGMNVVLPFGANPYGFWFVIGSIVILISLTFYIFNRNRWL